MRETVYYSMMPYLDACTTRTQDNIIIVSKWKKNLRKYQCKIMYCIKSAKRIIPTDCIVCYPLSPPGPGPDGGRGRNKEKYRKIQKKLFFSLHPF